MTKKEARVVLGISARTLERRIKAGIYKHLRGRPYTREDLGLPPETPAPVEAPLPPPRADILAPMPISHDPKKPPARPDPAAFRDSMGNRIGDPNPVSLLGPNHPEINDTRTTIKFQPISFCWGHGDGGPNGCPTATGYGLTIEQLQRESAYLRTHPKAAQRFRSF